MSVVKGLPVEELLKRGSIRDLDIARFRRSLHEDGTISRAEAEQLFAVDAGCPVKDASWSALYVEAIADYLVGSEPPEGYVTADNAAWLVGRIARGGRVESKAHLDLLVRVLDKARWAPESLGLLALEQVRHAVRTGEGPLRAGQSVVTGRILDGEVELVRRILHAFGGPGSIAVTQAEADVLVDIEEALRPEQAAPAWSDLFVKALANAMLSASGYQVPSREEALRREAWLDRRGDLAPAELAAGMLRASLGGLWSVYRQQGREERAIAQLELRRIEIITSEAITPAKADWLAGRLGRDGRLSSNERLLLDVLGAGGARMAPALQELVGRIGKAA